MRTRKPIRTLAPRVATANLSKARPLASLPGGVRSLEASRVHQSRKWREKVRPAKLERDPLCQRCKLKRLTVEATQVDHRTPIAEGGDPWADDNLVSLCAPCHSEKTRCEQLGQPYPDIAPSTPRRLSFA